jgi:glucose dehydrogenase
VPKGDVPTEWYSPTQPFPVKPARPLSRVDFSVERDLVRPEDTSAAHVEACKAVMQKNGGFANAGPFTPFNYHEDGTPPKSTIQFPGGTGGVNWGGTSGDPKNTKSKSGFPGARLEITSVARSASAPVAHSDAQPTVVIPEAGLLSNGQRSPGSVFGITRVLGVSVIALGVVFWLFLAGMLIALVARMA